MVPQTRLPFGQRLLRLARFAIVHRRVLTIPTHLTLHERTLLYELARNCASRGPVGEIGSYLGASSCALAAGIVDSGRGGPLICVDTWQNEGMAEGLRDTFAEFRANTAAYAACLSAVRGRSHEVAAQAARRAGALWELVFFDGDHSEEGVRGDWQAYRPHLAAGAVVGFHDIGWAEGVQRVFAEMITPELEWIGRLPNLVWGRLRE